MSYWGATVITNLFSAIPFIGTDIVQFIWGGFSVSNATLNRFFSLHFLLPFLLAALIVLHFIALHQHGSNNPLGITSNGDKLPFHPYFTYKDYVTFFLFFLILSFFIFFIPNFMGEADNYIPGNPLVTPPSIDYNILLNISTFIETKNLKIDTQSVSEKGYMFIKNERKLISKKELLTIINSSKEKIKRDYKSNPDWDNMFRQLINGFFQAEGHIGGYFETKFRFRPIVYLSQNASEHSIELFSQLSLTLNDQMNWVILKNDSNIFHIRIQSRDWNFIINTFISYFSLVYGDKYKGLKKLNEIHKCISNPDLKNNIELIKNLYYLAYNLVDYSQRKINLNDALLMVTGTKFISEHSKIFKSYNDSNNNITLLFIIGLYLGDGSLTIRIRNNNNKNIWFIPVLKISQKITEDNYILLNKIRTYLNKFNIISNISKSNHLYILQIENKTNIIPLLEMMDNFNNFLYFKKYRFFNIKKSFKYLHTSLLYIKPIQFMLLNYYYSININFEKPKSYWMNILLKCSNNNKSLSNHSYINISKNTSWCVILPVIFKIRPRRKYFYFKTYNNSKTLALEAAIKYKEDQINLWLKNNHL